MKRGREYMDVDITIHAKEGDRLLVEYRDTVCLSYRDATQEAA
jgi:hypothetical protein